MVGHLDLTLDIDRVLSDQAQITVLRYGEVRAGLIVYHKVGQIRQRYSLRVATEGQLIKDIRPILQIGRS